MLSPMLAGAVLLKSTKPAATGGTARTMSREAYDQVDAVNWSKLKHLLKSPAHYRHAMLHPEEDTDAKKIGRCIHLAALEPENFARACIIWGGGRRAGKDWDAFKKKHADREILKPEEHAHCIAVATAVKADANASPLISGGQAEGSLLWLDERLGIECKARLDFITSKHGALVDLKKTRDSSLEGFGREVWRYHYHAQAALYSDGYFAVTGRRPPSFFVAVEDNAPHVVQVYRVPDSVLELGRAEYRGLMDTLVACRASNSWGGYGQGEQLLSLPRWAAPLDELEEMGLIMPGAAAEGGA